MFCVYLKFEMTNGDGNIKYPWKFVYLEFDENGYAEEREWLCSEEERGIQFNPKITIYEIHHSRDSYVGTVTYEKNVLNCK